MALEDILRLSQAMLSAARSEDFERLAQLESRRSELLARIPELGISPLQLAEALKQIKALDRAILAILEQEQETAAESLRKLRHARRAVTAYGGSE